MSFSRVCFCAVVWMTLTIHLIQATYLGNDISTKLAELTEQMTKMSGQLSKVSEQQREQSGQLAKLSKQQLGQSGQLSKLSEQQQEHSGQLSTVTEQQSQTSDQVSKLTNQMTELTGQQAASSSSGPVYVRWGRKTCNGTGSEIVYTGVAGGSPSVDAGGGAELLCLPRDPSYANHDNVDHIVSSHIMVAEYKMDSASNFPFENDEPVLLDADVPCAVCQVTNGSSVMMIPARVDCYSGWKLEYRGYLMTAEISSNRIHYVCVDANPEVDYGGSAPADYSVSLSVAETRCNYLPCPPFENVAETACVVCSK